MDIKKIIQGLLRIAVTFICFYSLPAFSGFEKAMEDYQAGKFEQAYHTFVSLSEIGEKSAQFNLGVMYFRGEFVERNAVRAYAWMNLASELGDKQFSNTASKVLETFSEAQQDSALKEAAILKGKYGSKMLAQTIFPKPLSDEDCPPEPTPIIKKPPLYPKKSLNTGKMGRVEIEFTISPEGYVRDVIANAIADKDLAKAAAQATKSWRYEVPSVGGDREPVYGVENLVTFMIKGATLEKKKLKRELKKIRVAADKGDAVAQYIRLHA